VYTYQVLETPTDLTPNHGTEIPEGCDREAWIRKYQREYITEVQHTNKIEVMNLETFHEIEGSWLPQTYKTLFFRTKAFIATVKDLIAATRKLQISSASFHAAEMARLIVGFSITIQNTQVFHLVLNSQRKDIYWMLDDMLVRICLDLWDDMRATASWDKVISPINLALATAQEQLQRCAELDMAVFLETHSELENLSLETFTAGHFERTASFLQTSLKISEIWRTVRLSGIGRLPNELANVIIADIFDFEKLPVGDLRLLYLPKGKCKAVV